MSWDEGVEGGSGGGGDEDADVKGGRKGGEGVERRLIGFKC